MRPRPFAATRQHHQVRTHRDKQITQVEAALSISLADEDGLKLLEQLKKSQPALCVIMLTGMGFVEDLLQEAQQKGADGYVSKVLPLDELLLAIQRILKNPPA